jgi:hypothetical protein
MNFRLSRWLRSLCPVKRSLRHEPLHRKQRAHLLTTAPTHHCCRVPFVIPKLVSDLTAKHERQLPLLKL